MDIQIRVARDDDLAAADRVFRLAFGTRLRLPDPMAFYGDGDCIRTRWRADPTAAFTAESQGELIASIFAARWGSLGILGPLSVHPKFWDRHVGRQLMERAVTLLEEWKVTQAGVFTAAHSPRHIALCQRFGFWPRFLTAIMSKQVELPAAAPDFFSFSEVAEENRGECLAACSAVTNELYEGLSVEREICAVAEQNLGETIFLGNASKPSALAVCHLGPRTEAGSGTCYVKFAAARPGPAADQTFERLLDACFALAHVRGVSRLVAGMNTAREEAYRRMLARGFRTDLTGIAMHRPNDPAYNRPGVFVIDDWR